MNCSKVQDSLSQFHDNELSQEEAMRVAAHVTDCSSCAAELASFQQLSRLSRRLTDPSVPAQILVELQSKLNSPEEPDVILAHVQPRQIPSRFLALAATILVAAGIGVIAYQAWDSPGQEHLTMNFSQYVEQFSRQPEEAQQVLLANYYGKPMTLQEATESLGYEPAVAKGIPPDYTIDKVYLLKMPCCGCAQVVCKNKAGQSIAIFEHSTDQPVSFGDRPTVEYVCHDKPTRVVQMGDQLAATWTEGQRSITIIGATDLDEVTDFVAHFSGAASALN